MDLSRFIDCAYCCIINPSVNNLSPLNVRHSTASGLSVRGTVNSMQMHLNNRAIAAHYQYKRQPSLLGDNTAEGPAGTLTKWDDRGGTRCPCVVLPRLSLEYTYDTRFLFEVELNGFLWL